MHVFGDLKWEVWVGPPSFCVEIFVPGVEPWMETGPAGTAQSLEQALREVRELTEQFEKGISLRGWRIFIVGSTPSRGLR